MKITMRRTVTVRDFDALIVKTYNRPYSFQQQDGCKMRGVEHVTVPADPEDYEAAAVTEKVNCNDFGVSFKAWLARDVKQCLLLEKREDQWGIDMWWERQFYPHVSMVVNDLHSRGLLDAGEYSIEIDW